MAHLLDTRNDGQLAAFTVGQKAWWDVEGSNNLAQAPSVEIAQELAGHNFEVEVQPIYLRRVIEAPTQDPAKALETYLAETYRATKSFPNAKEIVEFMDRLDRGDEIFTKIEGSGATVRTDRNVALGIVGSRYAPFQNADAWQIIEPLLDAGLASLETGGTIREGRDIWILLRLNIDNPVVQEVYGAEGLVPYIMLVNNHAGTRVVIGKEVVERVVCKNTLEIALGEHSLRQFRVRHSGDVDLKVTDAAMKMFEAMVERHVKAASQYQALRGSFLDRKMFEKLVLDAAAPISSELTKTPREKLSGRQRGSLERTEARRARLEALWTGGVEHKGDYSAFEAYQAVTQSLDHDSNLWIVRGDGTRAEAQIFGRLSQIKRTVLANLLKASVAK